MAAFETFSPCQVCTYLKQEIPTLSQDVLSKLEEHKIDGELFLGLNDEYLKELAPLLGDRLKLKRVINAALQAKVSAVSGTLLHDYVSIIKSICFCVVYIFIYSQSSNSVSSASSTPSHTPKGMANSAFPKQLVPCSLGSEPSANALDS